jgi:hypothetical protein
MKVRFVKACELGISHLAAVSNHLQYLQVRAITMADYNLVFIRVKFVMSTHFPRPAPDNCLSDDLPHRLKIRGNI